MKKNKQKNSQPKKIIVVVAITLAVICLAFFILEITKTTHIFNNPVSETATTTSTEPSAQNDFNSGKAREVIQSNKEEGTVTDTNGNVNATPPESEWTSSSDSVISVYSPVKNSILSSGQILSGQSANGDVSFRLIDNISGMIAQGKISVVNNKFSGLFNFDTKATEGRLDVFIASADGTESSVVEIPIRFNQ